MDIKTIVFYACAILLTLSLTATPRTGSARLPMFGCLTLNVVLEKLLVSLFLSGSSHETVHSWLWLCRRFSCTLAALALVHAVLHHTDVGKKTLAALDDLKEMQERSSHELQEKLRKLEGAWGAHADGPTTAATGAPLTAEQRARVLGREIVRSSQERLKTSPARRVYRRSPPASGCRPVTSPSRDAAALAEASPTAFTGLDERPASSSSSPDAPDAPHAVPPPPPPPPPPIDLCAASTVVALSAADGAALDEAAGQARAAASPRSRKTPVGRIAAGRRRTSNGSNRWAPRRAARWESRAPSPTHARTHAQHTQTLSTPPLPLAGCRRARTSRPPSTP